jgi:enamine deaminase RidA (YjgF/YER057c/UK114 family)
VISAAIDSGTSLGVTAKPLLGGLLYQGTISSIEDRMKLVLAANGMAMDDVVFTSVSLKDLNDFAKMNAVSGTYF